MANVSNMQMSPIEQALAFFGIGDNGERGSLDTGMTVPTGFNTSNSWTPPGAAITGSVTPTGAGGMGTGLGLNVGTGQVALSGLGALASVWGASKQNKLANDQFKFQKDFANTNLNNSIKSYNTTLEDRLTARGAVQGQSSADVQEQIARNRLSR